MPYSSKAKKTLTAQLLLEGGIENVTLAAALVLTHRSANIQRIDPGGSNRTVTLPAEETSDGLFFLIYNTADAAENLTLQDDAGSPSTIQILNREEWAIVGCDGTTWRTYATSITEAALNAVTASLGASMIGVQDSGSLLTATTVEAALAELAALRPDFTVADPANGGAIAVTKSGVCSLTSAGAGETRTLAIPTFRGQRLTLIHDTDGGAIAVTCAQAVNQTGNTVMTFTEPADFIELVAATVGGALRWRVVVNDGVVLS